MATFNKFNQFVQDLGVGSHDLANHSLKVAFSNTLPVATNTVLANITQIGTAGGYTSGAGGGVACPGQTYTNTGGTSKLVIPDVTFTASGAVGPFRYVVLYNDSPVGDPLIGWYDYGSSITLAAGESFTVDFDGTAGVLTLA